MSIFAVTEGDISARLEDLRAAVRAGLVDPEIGTLGKQAELLAEHCMKLTPPRSAAQGRARVQKDIRKIFHPVDPAEIKSASVRRLVYTGDAEGWAAFARNVKKGPFANTLAVIPSEVFHEQNRDSRGRARKTNLVTLWPQRGALKELIKSAQTRVGWAKAGWLRGYLALGGTRAPDFVRRHGAVRGQFTDGRRDPTNPFIDIRNDTSWGKLRGESDRIVGQAIAARARAMQTYFNKMMQLAARGIATPWQQLRSQFTDAA